MNAPEFGDLAVGDQFQKHSYPFGIMVNATGKRFVDEGADFRNYTYAKYGRVVLEQPGQFAWQIFDQKVKHLLRDEYRIRQITKVTANTIEEFAQKLEGVNAAGVPRDHQGMERGGDAPTCRSIRTSRTGAARKGLAINKSNWANTIDAPPFEGYAVTCGVTFTFGGLRINTDARSAQHRLPADPRPLCRGRTGRRAVLLQLSGRHRADVRRGVRQDRRRLGRRRRREVSVSL